MLLEQLVDAWIAFADRVATLPALVSPGELFYQGVDDNVASPLFPSGLGSTGFGARNYGNRFRAATGLPLGALCRRMAAAGPAAP